MPAAATTHCDHRLVVARSGTGFGHPHRQISWHMICAVSGIFAHRGTFIWNEYKWFCKRETSQNGACAKRLLDVNILPDQAATVQVQSIQHVRRTYSTFHANHFIASDGTRSPQKGAPSDFQRFRLASSLLSTTHHHQGHQDSGFPRASMPTVKATAPRSVSR
eukprot:4741734-Pleurochrysis_carterae.AAC.2